MAPVGTPEAIIRKVSEDLRKVVVEPELDKKLATLGSYTNPMSPAETTAFVHKQQQMWHPVLDEIARTAAMKEHKVRDDILSRLVGPQRSYTKHPPSAFEAKFLPA